LLTLNLIAKKTASLLCCDPVLFAALAAAVVSALFVPPSKNYLGYLDLRVLCLLLALMLVVAGLQKAGVFGFVIERSLKLVHNTRTLAAVLIGVCFFSSMLITNDVALITFVPLGMMMLIQAQKQKLLIPVIILQTVAANLGSMLTPLGNPQNLYLYSLANMTVWQFLRIMAVPTAISFLMLSASVLFFKPELIKPLKESPAEPVTLTKIVPWIILFTACLLAVLHILPYGIALAAVIAGVLIMDRTLLLRADYGLLLTFIFLFIFIGNIRSIPAVSSALSALISGRELPAGILLSQIISNVPAAMLLSKFTAGYPALLIGVNFGGLGTLIASMASVISYKLYAAAPGARKGKYLGVFTAVNVLFLGILWIAEALFKAL
jgi:Na+/H+ antiporter NhaD/arsenite permease-like protein